MSYTQETKPNFVQLALDFIEIQYGPSDKFDAMRIMRGIWARWNISSDWHDWGRPLELLEKDNRIFRDDTGAYPGMAQYRRFDPEDQVKVWKCPECLDRKVIERKPEGDYICKACAWTGLRKDLHHAWCGGYKVMSKAGL